MKNSNQYKSVSIVDKLPPKSKLGGEIVTVDELTSNSNYYDGMESLRINSESCSTFTNSINECLSHANCGWCGSSKSCISGNNIGPLEPCFTGTYKYSESNSDLNKLLKNSSGTKFEYGN